VKLWPEFFHVPECAVKNLKLFLKVVLALLLPVSAATFANEAELLDLQVDSDTGQVLLRLESLPLELPYVPARQSGVGSNDLGLDRGQVDRTRLSWMPMPWSTGR